MLHGCGTGIRGSSPRRVGRRHVGRCYLLRCGCRRWNDPRGAGVRRNLSPQAVGAWQRHLICRHIPGRRIASIPHLCGGRHPHGLADRRRVGGPRRRKWQTAWRDGSEGNSGRCRPPSSVPRRRLRQPGVARWRDTFSPKANRYFNECRRFWPRIRPFLAKNRISVGFEKLGRKQCRGGLPQ